MRRRTPLKVSKPDWICLLDNPQCLAAAMTARALRTLNSPIRLRWNLKLGISNSVAVGP